LLFGVCYNRLGLVEGKLDVTNLYFVAFPCHWLEYLIGRRGLFLSFIPHHVLILCFISGVVFAFVYRFRIKDFLLLPTISAHPELLVREMILCSQNWFLVHSAKKFNSFTHNHLMTSFSSQFGNWSRQHIFSHHL